MPAPDDSLLLERYRSLADATRLAWGAIAVVAVAVALALAGATTIPHPEPVQLDLLLGIGLATLTLGVAISVGVLVRGALEPRPGLAAVRAVAERTDVALAGMTDARSRAEVLSHRAEASHDAADVAADAATRRGRAAAVALVAAIVGGVALGYGVAVQVSDALDPVAPILAIGVPLLVLLAAGVAALFDPAAFGRRLVGLREYLPGGR